MKLRDFTGGQRPSRTIDFRGESLEIRDLTGGEAAALARLLPRPTAPLGPDPRKGSLAPPIHRVDDARYIREAIDHRLRVRPAEVAIACGWTDDKGRQFIQVQESERAAWCEAARAWCECELSDGELLLLARVLDELAEGVGGTREESPKG